MPEHYNDIRSMIKSKKECRQTQHKASEQDRFEKLLAVNKAMLSPDMLQIDKLPADKFENFCKLLSEYGIQLNSPADLEDMPLEQQNLLAELANKFTQMDWQGYGLEDFAPHPEDKLLPVTDGDGNDVARSHEGFSLDDNGEITGKIMLSAKEEKGSEDDSEGSKDKNEEKSEEKEPKTDSEPPKSDPEEAQDDEPAPDAPISGPADGEIDYSELGEILADIEETLGEEATQEIFNIVMEHLDDDEFEAVMEAKDGAESDSGEDSEADSIGNKPEMEPFDGGAAVLMGVEGADEPEDEYVSIRECINLRKSGNRYSSYNREMSVFKKAGAPAGEPTPWTPEQTAQAKAKRQKWEQERESEVINAPATPWTPEQKAKAKAERQKRDQDLEVNEEINAPATPWTPEQKAKAKEKYNEAAKKYKSEEAEGAEQPAAAAATTDTSAVDQAKDAEKRKILQEQSDAYNKQYGPGATGAGQATASQPRIGGGNNYYSLLGPKMNGQPGLMSRLLQAIRNWRLNSARVKQAGEAAASTPAKGSPTQTYPGAPSRR